MQLHTQAIGFSLTEAILGHVDEKIQGALAPASHHVVGVTIRLDDVNGKRGGIDKRCRVVAELRGAKIVTVQAVSSDLYTAISKAANRIKHATARALKRRKARERKDPQRPGAFGEHLDLLLA